MIFGAILAGGTGSRMNISEMPKQFLPLDKKPIIIHTLEKFLMSLRLDYIYLGIHKEWMLFTEDLIQKYVPMHKEKIKIIEGGTDRNSTIMNVIKGIEEDHGENDDHIIITHDSVRPFVSLKIIEDNIDAALKHGACDTAVNATDTIVVSEDNMFITSVPERKKMYQGQTPQSFNINKLKKYYYDLNEDERLALTDACKIFVVRNHPVFLVKGSVSNFKITTIEDYKIAQSLVGGIVVD